VVIVGGGQGGIALGARMRQLGVPAIVVDKHDRPGDQWRNRYKSLCLMWKPTQQPGLWFHGGNLHQSRHYSLYLALQLKARHEGIPTPCTGCRKSIT
jgi:cation diffusion facilitator CzcD-associated flavoprotein CzcO